jgi:hypothetical protein
MFDVSGEPIVELRRILIHWTVAFEPLGINSGPCVSTKAELLGEQLSLEFFCPSERWIAEWKMLPTTFVLRSSGQLSIRPIFEAWQRFALFVDMPHL